MKFDSLSMRARRHAAGVVAMAMGSFGVFFLLHVMNADEGPPEQEDDGKKVAFGGGGGGAGAAGGGGGGPSK